MAVINELTISKIIKSIRAIRHLLSRLSYF